jgi:hypothetical protein
MATPHQNFDAAGTLDEIRDARAVRRKRRTWGKSRLVPHQAELVKLRAEGASFEDLAFWLLKNKRMKVDRSTVRRFLDKSKEATNGG